jgi:hypothetical protein
MQAALSIALHMGNSRVLLDNPKPESCIDSVVGAIYQLTGAQASVLKAKVGDDIDTQAKNILVLILESHDSLIFESVRVMKSHVIVIADASKLPNGMLRLMSLSAPATTDPCVIERNVVEISNVLPLMTPMVKRYLLDIIVALRQHPLVAVASDHAGSLELERSSKTLALLESRDYVCTRDVDAAAILVLPHRLLLDKNGKLVYSLQEARNIVKYLIHKAIRAPI